MMAARFGKVGVLAGGISNEREISLKSGKSVCEALVRSGIDAILLDVRSDTYGIITQSGLDVAFIALHGRFGEDGKVQKILEDAGIPYTGSGPEASRLAIDKIAAKHIFAENGIPVPKYAVFENGRMDIKAALSLGFPLVVKPQYEGSSFGLSIVRDKAALKDAVELAYKYGPKVLLEEHIDGRELTVGVLNNEPLPVIEIVCAEHVYDYTAKYKDPKTKYLVPAPIDKNVSERVKNLGRMAHKALGCRDFSRTDIMLGKNNDIFVLEVNTIPGMTERSLLPKAAQAIGLSFEKLCVMMIENAVKGVIN